MRPQVGKKCVKDTKEEDLGECVYVWVYIIVIQYQLRPSNVFMSKKRNDLTLRHKVALINEAESGKWCRVGRTHRSIDQRLANVNVPIRTVAPPSDCQVIKLPISLSTSATTSERQHTNSYRCAT